MGLLKPTNLAEYRRNPVFIRQSKHMPPRWQIVGELREEFFQLITQEEEPAVRVVLEHFFFFISICTLIAMAELGVL